MWKEDIITKFGLYTGACLGVSDENHEKSQPG
jgi:hypothetical protein